jgi:hypothetical protein
MLFINVLIPSFIEKISRTAKDSDRDAGFRDLVDEFDKERTIFICDLLKQSQDAFSDVSRHSLDRIRTDAEAYKNQFARILKQEWAPLKGPTFRRMLNLKGTIPKGVSKAQSLESGRNFNKQLSDVLAPGFKRWFAKHAQSMKAMKPALTQALDRAHLKIITMMNESSANLVVVEKSKKKWSNFRPLMEAKNRVFMQEVDKLERKSYVWATMEDGRENSLLAKLTDAIFDAVLAAGPATRVITTGKNKGKERLVSPKIQFQKDFMMKLVLSPDSHLLDKVIEYFQHAFDTKMNVLLKEHFADMDRLMETFSDGLRKRSPIDYVISSMGETVRSSLLEQIEMLQTKSEELKSLLPTKMKHEHDESTNRSSSPFEQGDDTVSELFNKMSKRKMPSEESTSRIHIKKEGEVKKQKF